MLPTSDVKETLAYSEDGAKLYAAFLTIKTAIRNLDNVVVMTTINKQPGRTIPSGNVVSEDPPFWNDLMTGFKIAEKNSPRPSDPGAGGSAYKAAEAAEYNVEVEVTIKETGDAQDLVQKSLGDDNVANSPRRCPRFVQGTSPIAAPTPSSAKKLEFSDEPRIHCIVLLGNSRRWCFVPHPEPTLDYAVKELNPLKNDREKGPSCRNPF